MTFGKNDTLCLSVCAHVTCGSRHAPSRDMAHILTRQPLGSLRSALSRVRVDSRRALVCTVTRHQSPGIFKRERLVALSHSRHAIHAAYIYTHTSQTPDNQAKSISLCIPPMSQLSLSYCHAYIQVSPPMEKKKREKKSVPRR